MKRRLDELALFGGPPSFVEPIHVGRPNIGDEGVLLDRIKAVLARRWLTNSGPMVEAFEEAVRRSLGVSHCVAVSSGALGLELLIGALGLDGEVILPSFTFAATAHALALQGVTPVFCEIDPQTHLIDPAAAAALVTPRTSAILGVHLWGQPCDDAALSALAARHGLALIYDAAHALGCHVGDMPVSGLGGAAVLSFHATKIVNSLEGGAIVTNDGALADSLRLRRNFGFADLDLVVSLGTNAKMNEFEAAMGLTSLESMPAFIAVNRANADRYRARLAGAPGIGLLAPMAGLDSNHHYVVAEVDRQAAGLGRDTLLAALRAEGVLARRYFFPGCHRMAPYRDSTPQLPVTEAVCDRVIQLPTGTAVGADQVDEVAALVRLIVAHGAAVEDRLARG